MGDGNYTDHGHGLETPMGMRNDDIDHSDNDSSSNNRLVTESETDYEDDDDVYSDEEDEVGHGRIAKHRRGVSGVSNAQYGDLDGQGVSGAIITTEVDAYDEDGDDDGSSEYETGDESRTTSEEEDDLDEESEYESESVSESEEDYTAEELARPQNDMVQGQGMMADSFMLNQGQHTSNMLNQVSFSMGGGALGGLRRDSGPGGIVGYDDDDDDEYPSGTESEDDD